MSLQLQCNCGWTSQVSEFYLGDRVSCPDCGVKLNVRGQSGVPYGYAPYPTWQKKVAPPMRVARHRTYPLFTPENPHTSPAFWLGLFSLLLTVTGCGAIPGALMAIFGVNSWARSRRFAKTHKQSHDGRATVGLAFSSMSLLACTAMAISMFGGATHCTHHHTQCPGPPPVETTQPHEFRYEERDAEWYTQQAERFRAQEAEWRKLREEQGYRYPAVEPEPTPVVPRDEWEQHQQDISEKVRKQRTGVEPEYRYGD